MKYYIFSSGSKGNATLVCDNKINILIDLGISKRELIKNLNNIGLNIKDISFILLTHDHSDHTNGLKSIKNIDIYGGEDVFKSETYHVITPYKEFKYKEVNILPIEVSHDATNPLGFIISNNKEKLVYITDTGYINEKNMKLASDATYYIIESNHDREMLLHTHRPVELKERIMSEFGHLCNEDAAMYLSHMIGNDTKEITLAHVSQEANTYALAEAKCIEILKKNHINIKNIIIKTAKQSEMVKGGYEN